MLWRIAPVDDESDQKWTIVMDVWPLNMKRYGVFQRFRADLASWWVAARGVLVVEWGISSGLEW